MRAMILAAGLGTRLRPITDELPKPLVPVVGVPNIVRIIRRLKAVGIEEIVINTHWLPDVLTRTLGDGAAHGVSIRYSREDVLLGTGGGIKRALSMLGHETFLVVNGDALFAPDFGAVINFHQRQGAIATMALRADKAAETLGAVGLDSENRVRRLVHAGDRSLAAPYMFTGLHVLEPELGNYLPDNGCIVRETYIPLLRGGAPLYGCPVEGFFCDLGTPERYLRANLALVLGEAYLSALSSPAGGVYIGDRVHLGDGCRLLPGTILGNGVEVASGVCISQAVVFDGARVACDLFSAIVTSEGEVVPV